MSFDPTTVTNALNKARMAITIVANLKPTVLALIDQADEVVPQGGQGAQKLAFVRSAVESIYATIEAVEVPFAQIWGVVEPLIALIIKARKAQS